VFKMLKKEVPISMIADFTGLPIEKILAIKEQYLVDMN